jgi:hypothetical protein
MKIQKRSLILYVCIEVVILLAVLSVLYFTYVTQVELETVRRNASILVNNAVDLFNINTAGGPRSARIAAAKDLLRMVQNADRGEAPLDAKIKQNNESIKTKVLQVSLAVSGTLFIIVLALMYFKVVTLDVGRVIQYTLVGAAVLVIAELSMIYFIATRYNPIDINLFLQIAGAQLKKANAKYRPAE